MVDHRDPTLPEAPAAAPRAFADLLPDLRDLLSLYEQETNPQERTKRLADTWRDLDQMLQEEQEAAAESASEDDLEASELHDQNAVACARSIVAVELLQGAARPFASLEEYEAAIHREHTRWTMVARTRAIER